MDWNKGFQARYYANLVDIRTWRDTQRLEITGGSIKRSDSNLRTSADIECKNYPEVTEKWIRVWLDARQNGDSVHVPLFTGLVPPPERDINGRRESNSLECYSVLQPANDVLLDRGWYAIAGVSGGEQIRDLLAQTTPAPVELAEHSPILAQYVIAEDGESHLSMALKLLTAIGWRLVVTGDGIIQIKPINRNPVVTFDPLNNDCIEPKVKASNDWYSCPNVFRAVIDDMYAIARDDNPDSQLSTVSRGREVWAEELDCNLNEDETLAEYAERMLQQAQQHALAIQYDRRFHPLVFPSDVIQLNYPAQKVDGRFYVSSQTISLGYGARTAEEVVRI